MIRRWIITAPLKGQIGPIIGRFNGSNKVTISFVPQAMTAAQALDIGQRLIEAGKGAQSHD